MEFEQYTLQETKPAVWGDPILDTVMTIDYSNESFQNVPTNSPPEFLSYEEEQASPNQVVANTGYDNLLAGIWNETDFNNLNFLDPKMFHPEEMSLYQALVANSAEQAASPVEQIVPYENSPPSSPYYGSESSAPQLGLHCSNSGSFSSDEESNSDSSKPKKSRKRKRTKRVDPPVTPTALTFSREVLLKMTSEELESFVREVETERELSSEEMKEVKRQRRLIKNRESAQASRIRKRAQIEEMEDVMKDLQNENDSLRSRIAALEKENCQLKTQMLQNDIILEMDNSPASPVPRNNKQDQSLWDVPSIKANTAKGICLMVVLFSFGLLFEASQFQLSAMQNNSLVYASNSVNTPGKVIEAPVQTQVQQSSSSFQNAGLLNMRPQMSKLPGGRNILGLDAEAETAVSSASSFATVNSTPELLHAYSKVPQQMVPIMMDGSEEQAVRNTWYNSNNTYLICNDIRQAGKPIVDNFLEHQELGEQDVGVNFNLVIPPHALGLGAHEQGVEVTCRVMDLKSRSGETIYSLTSMGTYVTGEQTAMSV